MLIKNLHLTCDSPVVTIRDLLTHNAGYPTDDPWADRRLNDTEEEFVKFLKKGIFFSSVPGTVYEYSNLGYAMLGYIISKVTGMYYTKFIDQLIEIPGILWDFKKVPASQLAHGYRWTDEKWKEEELLEDGIFGAMGGIITSVKTFSQYAAMHLSAWPPRNGSEAGPLKRSSIREMHQLCRFKDLVMDTYPSGSNRVTTNGYGYGLTWSKDEQGRIITGHSGGLPGFGSNWSIMPEYGIGVILLTNVTYAPASKINVDVLDRLVVAAKLKTRELPTPLTLDERKKALVEFLPNWDNATTSGIFADNFFLDYWINSLKKESIALFAKAGQIISVGDLIPQSQTSGYFIIKGENINLKIDIALTPENPALIQHYQIKVVDEL